MKLLAPHLQILFPHLSEGSVESPALESDAWMHESDSIADET